jgi:hypothetical protein
LRAEYWRPVRAQHFGSIGIIQYLPHHTSLPKLWQPAKQGRQGCSTTDSYPRSRSLRVLDDHDNYYALRRRGPGPGWHRRERAASPPAPCALLVGGGTSQRPVGGASHARWRWALSLIICHRAVTPDTHTHRTRGDVARVFIFFFKKQNLKKKKQKNENQPAGLSSVKQPLRLIINNHQPP